VVAAFVGCTAPEIPAPASDGEPWAGTSTSEGGVTTVINESGSAWRGTAVLVEEASIGAEFGRDPYMFGRVSSVAGSGDHIYVTDRQVGALRVYDWDGRYVRDIGRKGQGPGEFQSAGSVGVDGEGRIWLDDMLGARVLVFTRAGDPLATIRKRPPLIAGSTPIVAAHDGRGYVLGHIRATDTTEERLGMIPYDVDGSVRELVDVRSPGPRPPVLQAVTAARSLGVLTSLYPRGIAVFAAAPAVVSGFPDTYRFRWDHLDGRSVVVERAGALLPLDAAESTAAEEAATRFLRGLDPSWAWPDDPLPRIKPAYTNLIPAVSGETWVVRPGRSSRIPGCDEGSFEPTGKPHCWREERIVDVFGADGRYLGDVVVPDDLPLERYDPRPFIRAADVIGVVEDDAGTIRVKRYRLVVPGESAPTKSTNRAS
jgi:hypothetical protein